MVVTAAEVTGMRIGRGHRFDLLRRTSALHRRGAARWATREEGLMCWIPLSLGTLMVAVGIGLIVRFYVGHDESRPEVASVGRTESLLVGALLASIGTLVLILGATGVVCQRLGLL
jgi:uncharacterized membrane protein YidH (DUF202 family)